MNVNLNDKDLFRWDKIPRKDYDKLVQFLISRFRKLHSKSDTNDVGKEASLSIPQPNPNDVDKEIAELKKEWDDIDTWVNTASENGLFTQEKVQGKIKEEILCKLKDAKAELDKKNIAMCREYLSLAQCKLYEAINCAPLRWRLQYKYAIHIYV